jgi:hypothetical protein
MSLMHSRGELAVRNIIALEGIVKLLMCGFIPALSLVRHPLFHPYNFLFIIRLDLVPGRYHFLSHE